MNDLMRATQCPKRVNRVVLTLRRPLPVFPDERTWPEPVGMSLTCQQTTLDTTFEIKEATN